MKKLFILTLVIIISFLCSINIVAEEVIPLDTVATDTESINYDTVTNQDTAPVPDNNSDNTALPAIEHIVNLFFDGNVTIPQIVEYVTIALVTIFSFAYNKYKRNLISKEKALSKTDIEIEELKKQTQDLSNQLSLLGNMIACAYLSNNLVDPELKKKLAAYADELIKNTTIDTDKLTEKLILAAQNPQVKSKITELKDTIDQEAQKSQEVIDTIKKDVGILKDILNTDDTEAVKASKIIDNLDVGG